MNKRKLVREQLIWDGIAGHLVDQYMRAVEELEGGRMWETVGSQDMSTPFGSVQDVVDDCRRWLLGEG